MKDSAERGIWAGLVTALLVLALVGAVSWWTVEGLGEELAAAERAHAVVARFESVASATRELETARRASLAANEPAFAALVEEALRSREADLAVLRELIPELSLQRLRVERLSGLLGRLDALAAAEQRMRGEPASALGPPGCGDTAPKLLGLIRTLVAEAEAEELARLSELTGGHRRVSVWLRQAVPAALALASLAALAAIGRLRHEDQRRRAEGESLRALNTALVTRLATHGAELDRAKAELEESENRHREVVDASPDAIFTLRGDRVASVNPAARRLLRAPAAAALIGRPMRDFLADAESEPVSGKRTGDGPREAELRAVDGQAIPVRLATVVLDSARGPITLVLAHDLSGPKRAEAQLGAAHARQQALARRLLEIQESERRQLARELHDEIGQALTATKLGLLTLPRPEDAAAAEALDRSIVIVEAALAQTRSLSLALRPPLLDDLGLEAALRWLADCQSRISGRALRLTLEELEVRPSPDVETACFRIAQEAITNALRHSGAERIDIDLRRAGPELVLTVRDDGRGFDIAAARARAAGGGSFGLLGMEERAELAGGRVAWRSGEGRGTELRAHFPLFPLAAESQLGRE